MKTRPLDIVYNAKIFQKIRDFFSIRRSLLTSEAQEDPLLTGE